MNTVVLTGRVVAEPERKQAGSAKLAMCSLAVNRSKGKGEQETSYFDLQFWNKLAETAVQYLKKGKHIAIKGELQQQRWKAKDGKGRSKILINVHSMEFLPDGQKSNNGGNSQNTQSQNNNNQSNSGDWGGSQGRNNQNNQNPDSGWGGDSTGDVF